MAAKRLKLTPQFPPLDVAPSSLEHDPQEHSFIIGYLTIEPTTSTEWGSPSAAAARALLVTEVTTENDSLIRTFHPAFANIRYTVYLVYQRDGKRIWVVRSQTPLILYTHVGGLEVHQTPDPGNNEPLGFRIVPGLGVLDLFQHSINPRRILSSDDLDTFRTMFPRSCGVRIWIGDSIQILYSSRAAMGEDRSRRPTRIVCDREVFYDVLDCRPSVNHIQSGERVRPCASQSSSTASIGLRIVLPDGTPALTTVTHAFVRLPGDGLVGRVVDCFQAVKYAVLNFRTVPRTEVQLPYVHAGDVPTSNNPLGQAAWLSDGHTQIGEISQTFDNPSNVFSYPTGYRQDLSLITQTKNRENNEPLPLMYTTSSLPVIDGWAAVSEALDGAPLFVTMSVAHSGPTKTAFGFLLGRQAQDVLLENVQLAIAEGTQYLWDREMLSQSVSLLWRCVPPPSETERATPEVVKGLKNLPSSVEGFSGSVLCLGEPTDAAVKALAFQNFETWCQSNINARRGEEDLHNIKGGFLLPHSVSQEWRIDHRRIGLENIRGGFSTVPRENRSSGTFRRDFSGPV